MNHEPNLSIHLSSRIAARMIQHALEEMPNECCGVLGGQNNRAASVYPLRNDEASPIRFFANPKDLFDASRSMRDKGEEMIGIYHSHPTSEAAPSQTDRDENGYPGLCYFIISLRAAEPDIRCYVLSDSKEYSPVEIVSS